LKSHEIASPNNELKLVFEISAGLIVTGTLEGDADELIFAAFPEHFTRSASLSEGVPYAQRVCFRKEDLEEEFEDVKDVALSRHVRPDEDVKGAQGKVDIPQAFEIPNSQPCNHCTLPHNTLVSPLRARSK